MLHRSPQKADVQRIVRFGYAEKCAHSRAPTRVDVLLWSLVATIAREQRKHRVIEPTPVAAFCLARDSLEVKPEPTNDRERSMIVRRGRDSHSVRAQTIECPRHDGVSSFRHSALPCGVYPEPVPELRAFVQMGEILETDNAKESVGDAITNGETARSGGVPIGGTRFCIARARIEIVLERYPRKPRLEMGAGVLHSGPQIARIRRIERVERQPRGGERLGSDVETNGDNEHAAGD